MEKTTFQDSALTFALQALLARHEAYMADAERDRLVLESCRERGIPVAVTMAGGYARKVEDTVEIHYRSIRRAADLLSDRETHPVDDAHHRPHKVEPPRTGRA
jgi:sugar phosphate isomerase/epimerase